MTTIEQAPRIEVADGPAVEGLVFRHATVGDWDAVAAVLNASRRGDGVDEVRTGTDLRAEYEPLDAFRVDRDLILAEVDGALVGFAVGILVHRDGALVGETWGATLHDWRRRGIGTAMWRWNHDRLAVEAAADPRPGPRQLRGFALDIEHAEQALFADQGYVPIRFGFEMRRFLTGALPEHPLPAGIEIRPVTPETERAIFHADNEAFEDHWGHREPGEGDFVARFRGPDVDTRLWRVAWDGDEVAGVVMNAIFHGENEVLGLQRGWLDHVSVRRRWRGRGLAKALCAASFQALRDEGMTEAWLGVDGSNPTGALQLYEGLGFTVARRWHAFGRPMDGPAPAGWTPARDATRAAAGGPGGPSPSTARSRPIVVAEPWPGSTRRWSSSSASRASDSTMSSGEPPGRSTRPQRAREQRVAAEQQHRRRQTGGRPTPPCDPACGGRGAGSRRTGSRRPRRARPRARTAGSRTARRAAAGR